MQIEELQPFLGRWKLVESRNFGEYLKASGAPSLVIKMAKELKPSVEISISNDQEWVNFTSKFIIKSVTTSSRLDGKVHVANVPGTSKSKGVMITSLVYRKDEKTIVVDVWNEGSLTRNRSKRWIENGSSKTYGSMDGEMPDNDAPATETKNGKTRLVLELSFGDMNDHSAENPDIDKTKVTTAYRIFEKI